MDIRTIRVDEIPLFLEEIMADYSVFAPRVVSGIISFVQITSGDEAFIYPSNSKRSPKDLFFPQTELMYAFEKKGKEFEVVEELPEDKSKRKLLFGMRPCDAKALLLLDKVFNDEEYKDPYYIQKREDTTVISVACRTPEATCFCTSLGGSPLSEDGADVFMIDIGDGRYLVNLLTDKGQEIAERYSGWGEATGSDLDRKAKVEEEATGAIRSEVSTKGVKEKLDDGFDNAYWERLHLRCLGCGVCSFLCPTCHCFDINDEIIGDKGRRIRTWDSCMFDLFTLHASGHNPRPSGKERMRQRIMHKFNYFVENFGEIACVGCGRCVRNCPVNLDIRKVIGEIASIF